MAAGSGGSRRGSYDTEQSDDSSTNSSGGQSTPKGRTFKMNATPAKQRELMSKSYVLLTSIRFHSSYNINHKVI